jgi:hypothetical protein
MAYTINEVLTDTNSVIVDVTITLKDGGKLQIPIPVYRPKDEVAVLETIASREKYEVAKAEIAPVLADIKAKLEALGKGPQVADEVVAAAKAKVG